MGAAASKQATKATRPLTSSLAQHQQPLPQATRAAPPPPPTTAQKTAQQQQQVSEDKSKDILMDGQDPTFLQNLSALGQVEVPHSGTPWKTNNRMLEILERRQANDLEAETPTPNRLGARTLSNLLDDRKEVRTLVEAQELCREYGVDYEVLVELSKHVNSPSVSSVPIPARSPEEDQDEQQLACWVDPPVLK